MIKLIAIDLDGTLLKSNHQPHEENIKIIKKLKEQGYIVVIATGRPYIGVTQFLDILNFKEDNDYVICFNGAMIVHPKSNHILHSSNIDFQALQLLVTEANKFGLDFYAYTDEEKLFAGTNRKYADQVWFTRSIPFVETDYTNFNEDSLFLKFLFAASKEKLDETSSLINPLLKEKYNVVRSGPRLIEVLDKKSNKADAVFKIASKFNITMQEVMAIGDADNDLSMIKEAKIGVAMGNAFDSVKEASDFVTLTNEEAGVAFAIKNLIFND